MFLQSSTFSLVVSTPLRQGTGFSVTIADVGCSPVHEPPTLKHPNHPITQQARRQWGLLILTAPPQLGDDVEKLHINRSLLACSTPSRCDLVIRSDAPTLRPHPQNSHWLKSHPHKSLSLHRTPKVVYYDEGYMTVRI